MERTQKKVLSRFYGLSHLAIGLYALLLSASLVVLTMVPLEPLGLHIPVALAHAYLLRSDPPVNAILNGPPQIARLWFSEGLNSSTSHAVIIDTTNHEVDTGQGTVNSSNATEIDVTPLLLRAGTYVVVWRAQSAEDGHITGGSFIFRIARPDGSVPPIPNVLPTGHFPGAAGSGLSANGTLDGPTIVQTVMAWLALLGMAFWVGGVLWETWIIAPILQSDPSIMAASQRAVRRFQWLALFALILVLLSDVGIVFGQAAEVAGDWSGIFSLPILRAVLFGSQFGILWWIREGIALLALLVPLLARKYVRSGPDKQKSGGELEDISQAAMDALNAEIEAIPDWWTAVLETFKRIPALPQRLVAGWCARSRIGRFEVLLGAALILAFALSGHAAAVPSSEAYALSVDLLHLLCTSIWIGGLFYLGIVFIPGLFSLTDSQRARVIALGLPEFSIVAILCVLILASTGSLNTAIHLTSFDQFFTTLYGRVLTVKIILFLVIIAISTYHAFILRMQLVQALRQLKLLSIAEGSNSPIGEGASNVTTLDDEDDDQWETILQVDTFTRGIIWWIQCEAVIGVAILLCVALLGAFAGTLAPASPAVSTQTSQVLGPFVQTQSVQGYKVTLKVAPDTFGANTFTVIVDDARGQPVQDAAVLAETTMLDMDMGTDVLQLQADNLSPGTFSGQGELTMAGNWQVRLRILPPNEKTFVIVVFKFAAR